MIIRAEQVKALDQTGQGRYEAGMLEELKQAYPRAVIGVEDAALRQMIAAGAERAKTYGFQSRGATGMFLRFQFLLGHEFDKDPLLYWIADILADREGFQEGDQVARLQQHVTDYLELVYGKGGEHTTRGIEHLTKTQPRELAEVGRAYEVKAIPWLQALHARKCAWAGQAAMQELVSRARTVASELNLTEPEGPPLAAGLMFAFGSGVFTDPLFPWVAVTLDPATEPDPRARMERLIARTQGYMRQALENRKEPIHV